MDIKNETYSDDSNLKISEDVIATIVAATAKDVAGVHAMAATPGKDVKRLFGKKGEGNGMTVTFIDGGVPFDPLQKPDPDVTLSAEERAVGGLGIFMIKKTMDRVEYRRENSMNILTIYKTI